MSRRALLLVVASAGLMRSARAAEVRVRAPAPCVEADAIGEQVEGLLGRPIASVDGVDFEVTIAAAGASRWTLRLDTIDRGASDRRTRALAAASCAELADAAAVAIVVSITSAEDLHQARPARGPTPAPPASSPAPALRLAPGAPRAVEAPSGPRTALAVAGVADMGAMPHASLGFAIEGALQLAAVRLLAQGALFVPRETRLASGVGGDFQLALVAALACLSGDTGGRVALLVCGGGEAGRLAGSGFGVTSPRTVGTLWLAGRAEGGAVVSLGRRVGLALRIGAVVPAFRPTFELDAATVHRPRAVTARATAGLEIGF